MYKFESNINFAQMKNIFIILIFLIFSVHAYAHSGRINNKKGLGVPLSTGRPPTPKGGALVDTYLDDLSVVVTRVQRADPLLIDQFFTPHSQPSVSPELPHSSTSLFSPPYSISIIHHHSIAS